MTVRVGINGFGRIGRNFFRAAKQRGADIDFVAVNDLGSLETMAHLLKYDSVLGQLPDDGQGDQDGITVDGDELQVLSERDPEEAAVGRPRRRRRRSSRPASSPRATPPRTTSRAARRSSSSPLRATAPTRRSCTASTTRRSTSKTAQGDLQRELHHELLRADGQGARRRVRRRAGADDDRPRLHRRPEARRRPAQGPPPGPRRRRSTSCRPAPARRAPRAWCWSR